MEKCLNPRFDLLLLLLSEFGGEPFCVLLRLADLVEDDAMVVGDGDGIGRLVPLVTTPGADPTRPTPSLPSSKSDMTMLGAQSGKMSLMVLGFESVMVIVSHPKEDGENLFDLLCFFLQSRRPVQRIYDRPNAKDLKRKTKKKNPS